MLLLIFSMMVHAQGALPEIPFLLGHFESKGQYRIQSFQKSEEVITSTEEGRKRLAELQASGFQCYEKKPQISLCVRSFPVSSVHHPELDLKVAEIWKGQFFSFERVVGEPELVTNTEFFKQWVVPQKSVLWEVPDELEKTVWNPITYVWTHGSWQIFLGSSLEGPFFQVTQYQAEQIKIAEKIEIRNGSVLDRYFVEVYFEKVLVEGK